MKIQAIDSNVKSMKLVVPFDGTITVDNDGCADVSEKCAEELVSKTNGWKYAGKAAEDKAKAEKKEAESEEEQEEEEEDDDTLTAENLGTMTVKELRELCAESGFNEDEYKNLKKSALIEYILSKVDEEESDDEEEE